MQGALVLLLLLHFSSSASFASSFASSSFSSVPLAASSSSSSFSSSSSPEPSSSSAFSFFGRPLFSTLPSPFGGLPRPLFSPGAPTVTFVALIFFMAFDFLGWPGKSFPGLQLSSSLDQASVTVFLFFTLVLGALGL